MAGISETFEELFRKRFGRSPTPQEIAVLIDKSVTSHNQSGGITAHTVNIGDPKRRLDGVMKTQLLRLLPKDRKIAVDAPLGDGEAIGFAEEIYAFLALSGYTMAEGGVTQCVWTPQQSGQHIDLESNPNLATVLIGHR